MINTQATAGRVCLTFNRKIKTTAVLTNQQTAQLCELINKATTVPDQRHI